MQAPLLAFPSAYFVWLVHSFQQASGDDLAAFGNGTFTVVVCNAAIFVMDWKRALAEWKRVLQPGGFLAFRCACRFRQPRSVAHALACPSSRLPHPGVPGVRTAPSWRDLELTACARSTWQFGPKHQPSACMMGMMQECIKRGGPRADVSHMSLPCRAGRAVDGIRGEGVAGPLTILR